MAGLGTSLAGAAVGFLANKITILVELDEMLKAMAGTKRKMQKFKELSTTIDAVIQDVESRPFIEDAVKDLLKKLKYLAYDLEDVVDYYDTKVLQKKQRSKTFLSPFRRGGHRQSTPGQSASAPRTVGPSHAPGQSASISGAAGPSHAPSPPESSPLQSLVPSLRQSAVEMQDIREFIVPQDDLTHQVVGTSSSTPQAMRAQIESLTEEVSNLNDIILQRDEEMR